MSGRFLLAVALLGGTVIGCGSLLDLEAFQQGEDPGTGGGGGGLVLPTCGDDDGVCLSPLPVGWRGPAVLVDANEASPSCAGVYPTLVAAGPAELAAEEATCDCACAMATGQSCPPPTFHQYQSVDCTPSNNGQNLPQTCTGAFSPPPTALSLSVDADTPEGGSCAPMPTENVPAPSSVERTLCETAPLEACNEGLCAGRPGEGFERKICIFAEGDLDCPGAEGYGEKVLIFEGVSDSRECTECTCGGPAGGACTGESEAHSTNQCSLLKATIPHDGSCVQLASAGFGSIMMDNNPVVTPGSCAPSLSEPTGAFEGTGMPTTVCCTPTLKGS